MLQHEGRRVRARRARILVVDDEPAVRQLVVRILAEAGYNVTAVAAGWEGIAAVASGPGYDLVVTNSFIPSLTGDQVVGYLRRLYPRQPILHLDDLAHPIGPDLGTSPSRPQPFRVTALLEAVSGVLRAARQAPS